MDKSYYLENITIEAQKNARHFMQPTEAEVSHLKVGEMVRLFFVLHFKTDNSPRAERMWVEISEINGHNFKGYLTNQPLYIKDLKIGDIVEFGKDNIATLIVASNFDEKKKAIITLKALKEREINWLVSDEPANPEDSGWQLFYGDEDDAYLSDPNNAAIISLEDVLDFEPRLEIAFMSDHHAFEWSEEDQEFAEVHDFGGLEE